MAGIFAKRKKQQSTPNPKPIPVYTQGDDLVTIDGKVSHLFMATEGTDKRTQDNVITGPIAGMNVQQIKEAIKQFHERNG